jgi:hypothetical protein
MIILQPAPPTAVQLQHRQQLEQRQLQVALERQRLEAQLLEDTKCLAKARFWELLVDFVQMRAAPADWLLQVPADHPLLRTNREGTAIVLTRSGDS